MQIKSKQANEYKTLANLTSFVWAYSNCNGSEGSELYKMKKIAYMIDSKHQPSDYKRDGLAIAQLTGFVWVLLKANYMHARSESIKVHST